VKITTVVILFLLLISMPVGAQKRKPITAQERIDGLCSPRVRPTNLDTERGDHNPVKKKMKRSRHGNRR
jgi:hypothetical protein